MAIYILSAACVFLFINLVIAGCLLQRAGKIINEYEDFYEDTIDSFETHLRYLHELTQNNVVLSADDDVQKVVKAIQAYYDMLIAFVNEGRTDQSP